MLIKTYTVKEFIDEVGTKHLERTCDGFNPLELMGILELTQLDILQQMSGKIKPDIVKRTVIEDRLKGE